MLDYHALLESDIEGMLEKVYSLPSQFGNKSFDFLDDFSREFDTILIGGMGGSAISGRFAASCFDSISNSERHAGQIKIISDYWIPANLLNSRSIVILVSYSGNTEEVLELAAQAKKSEAYCCAVTTGGKLGKLLEDDALLIPAGLPPRAALGHIFSGVWSLLGGVLNRQEKTTLELECIKACLGKISDKQQHDGFNANNPLVELAGRMIDTIPIIYSPGSIYEAAAYRWKCQFNENAKHPCFFSVFPEWNHNEIEGLNSHGIRLKPVFLRDREEHPRISKRIDITGSILSAYANKPEHVFGGSGNFMERLFALAYFGDLVSLYLALLKKVNPTSIDRITRLKEKLS